MVCLGIDSRASGDEGMRVQKNPLSYGVPSHFSTLNISEV